MAKVKLKPDQVLLELKYVPLTTALQWEWERNPKKHDIPKLAEAITKNGFQVPPKFDATLNDGQGGLVFGNGRTHALKFLKDQNAPLPSGIDVTEDGDWAIPVLFGVDQASQTAAVTFAIDHNNLTMAGGDFTAIYMTQMWDEAAYVQLLKEQNAEGWLPVTVDAIDLELFDEFIIKGVRRGKRVDKGVKVRVGRYSFYVSRAIFEPWVREIEDACENSTEVLRVLRRRLFNLSDIAPQLQDLPEEAAV
ncbi:MAG: hypothetical protein KJ077_10635 [Anaerolineae bacterium]|nr:hypothetical protein [Anaerolineae bacterium]